MKINAQSQILMTKGKKSHGVSIESEFHIKANNVIVNGSSRETYDPFPEEENNYSSASFKIVQKDLLAGRSEKQTGWIKGADGTWQYFYSNGEMATGWMKDGNTWYYFDPSSGTMATNAWKQDSKGDWYYLGSDGKMVTDTWEQDSKGNLYHLDADGKMEGSDDSNLKSDYNLIESLSGATPKAANVEDSSVKDRKLLVGASIRPAELGGYDAIHYPGSVLGLNQGDGIIPEKEYIISPYTHIAQQLVDSTERWVEKDGSWYYYFFDLLKATGWNKINDKWYYFDDDGKMQTGWVQDNGNWYYLNYSGEMQTGWVEDNGNWYHLDSNGAMETEWVEDNGNWYYLNSSGAMKTGWIRDNGNWYYLDSSGAMKTGWVQDNGNWYYLNSSGAMKTGWLQDKGNWYYLDSSGAMKTGWIKDNGDSYYLNDEGVMLYDTTVDGYYLDSSGKCQDDGNGQIDTDDDGDDISTPVNINISDMLGDLSDTWLGQKIIDALKNIGIDNAISFINNIINTLINELGLQDLTFADMGHFISGVLASVDDNIFLGLAQKLASSVGNIAEEDNHYYMLGKVFTDGMFLAAFLKAAGTAAGAAADALATAAGSGALGILTSETGIGFAFFETAAGAELVAAATSTCAAALANAGAAHSAEILRCDSEKLENTPQPKLEIVIKDGKRYIDGKPVKINQGQQDKHIVGTNNYNQAVNAGQQKSILTGDADKLLDEFAGTGTKVSEYKERVDFGQVIGKFYNIKTGLYEETTMGMITYGKNGAHIIPSNPKVY